MKAIIPPIPRVIFAFDPGKTTGVAVYDVFAQQFHAVETEGRFELYRWFCASVGLGIEPEVVCENFTVRADTHKMSPQPDAWRIIGYLEGLCHQNGYRFTLQSPAEAKVFASDEKLTVLGWNVKTEGGHARDAARHLLVYLVNHYKGRGEPGAIILERLVKAL